MGTLEPVTLETIEADCRKKIAEVARIEVRGYDTARARATLLVQIDRLLDAWNAAATLLAHEFDAEASA